MMDTTRTLAIACFLTLLAFQGAAGKNAPNWSATTREAASADANKKVLAQGRPATITGEVIDVSCFVQLGKRGAAHLACGRKCIMNGEPIGLVDDKGRAYVLMAEPHHPRRDGEVSIREAYLDQLSKRVTVTGIHSSNGGIPILYVPLEKTDTGSVPAAQEYYVCPMHPDMHASHPGTCAKCGMALERSGDH
jgi:hypothetical protein